MAEGIEVFTLGQRPELEDGVRSLPGTFPEFMHHDAVVERYWGSLFTDFAGFQIAVCDDDGEVHVAGHCIPVFWDGTVGDLPAGLDGVLERGMGGTRSDGGFGPPGGRAAGAQGTRAQQSGALRPVEMDLERDLGVYIEPNVWMRHPVMGG